MKQKKWILVLTAITLVSIGIICLGIVLVSGKKDDKYIKSAVAGDISRYEWMEMLCEQSGLTEYKSAVPYYEDVNADSPYFPYIQSAVEWGVLASNGDFDGDGYASGRFVALTAMKTIGEKKLEIYLGTDEAIGDDDYIELAIDHGFIEKTKLTEGMSAEEGELVLERLKNRYFTEFWRDDYSDVTYQENVVELSPDDVLQSNAEGTEIVVTNKAAKTLESGTIIVFEQENTKLKVAREITGISSAGTLSLSSVELEQVVESLTVSDITELTFEDIVNYYETEGNDFAVNSMEYRQGDEELINTSIFSIDKKSEGFKISLSTKGKEEDRHLEIKITDHATKVSEALPLNVKVKGDSEYDVEIDIKKILIGGQVNYKVLHGGVQYADVAIDVDSTVKGTIKMEEEKKIPILKTPISLGNGFAGANIQIYLILSMEGDISFGAELPMDISVYFEKDKGFRNFRPEISPVNLKAEANCDAEALVRIEPTLFILSCVDVVDLEADVGMEAGAKITTHSDSQVCADISVSCPVITISACGDDDADTMIGKKGWSAEWKIISADKEEDGALFQSPLQLALHYERLPDQTGQYVEKCTYSERQNEKDNDKPDIEESIKASNTYYTRYKEITRIDRPTFCFDYPDGWEITREEVVEDHEDDTYMQYYGEIVELTNERGARVTYTQYKMEPGLVGSGSFFDYEYEYEVEKIGESSLSLSQASDPAELIVARIKELGGVSYADSYRTGGDVEESFNSDRVSYALLLNDKEGLQTVYGAPAYYGMCSFYYPEVDSFQIESESIDGNIYTSAINPYTFIAESSDGKFTEEEEKEVIEILSSFREVP